MAHFGAAPVQAAPFQGAIYANYIIGMPLMVADRVCILGGIGSVGWALFADRNLVFIGTQSACVNRQNRCLRYETERAMVSRDVGSTPNCFELLAEICSGWVS